MQKGFTDELQRLRPGRCQFCGERWFATQTPTQAAAVAEEQYTSCDRCKRDKKPVKYFSSANDMDPGTVPDLLKGLTQAEEMLLAKGCPVMRIYRLKKQLFLKKLEKQNAQEPRADDGQGRRRPGKAGVYSGIDVRVSQPR